jgi:hypothetical protein
MPIVGSFAGASARAYGLGAGVTGPGDFESIATVTVGTATPTVEFTSIPATYTHLQIRGISRNVQATNFMQFNNDTASNYSSHYVLGDGATTIAGVLNSTKMYAFFSTATANIFGVAVIDILDYANTNKYKTIRSLSGGDENGSGYAELLSGNWRNTAAITSIKLSTGSGNLEQYSSFALYGVKA